MNNDSCTIEKNLELSIEDRIEILFQELELAVRWDRPSILFAIYKSDLIRDEVNAVLEEKLKSISQKTHRIRTDNKDGFNFLSQISQFQDLSQSVLLIEGFNWECGTEGVGVFKEFNEHREYFIDNNIRAIFWLFENEVSDFAENATECWILRHRVVEFVDIPPSPQGMIQSQEMTPPCTENSPSSEVQIDSSLENGLELLKDDKGNVSHANALLRLGMLFWRQAKPKRALKYLQISAKISTTLADASLQTQCQNALALVHTDLGNIEEAVLAYQQAITLSPESEILWSNLGHLLAKNERNEEAINAFQKALEVSPRDYLSWDGIGNIYIKLGVYQNAISAFKNALGISPDYDYSWAGIGKAYLESGQLEEAKSSLCKAVELNPHLTDAWLNLGNCFAQQERALDAISVFQKAIEINPQSVDLWNELGRFHLQSQNYAESIPAFQKVISLNSQCGDTYIRLAYALYQIGDFEKSASIYESSIPLFEDNATRSALWNRLGDSYLNLKDYEKAITAYKQSDQLPDGPRKSDEIADLINDLPTPQVNEIQPEEHEESEIERGKEMIEANQIFDSKTAAEWNEHGNNHLRAGAFNDAIVAYTKAIELAPDACWPYIQNLAHVHYQKGKARGKQYIGKIEDPDLWEGDDELDSASLIGDESIPTPERNQVFDDLELQDVKKKVSINQFPTRMEKETKVANKPLPVEDPSSILDMTAMKAQQKGYDGSGCECKKKKADPQMIDNELEPASQIPSLPQGMNSNPRNTFEWNELGNSYASSNKLDEAIDAYKKAIEINPGYGQPYSNLGFLYNRLGKHEIAIQFFKKSIELLNSTEDKAVSWNRLGDAYRRTGDYGNASAAYKKSSEMAPAVNPVMARARVSLLENVVAG
jgi:tetratricopeptide (TPR) repeat protein